MEPRTQSCISILGRKIIATNSRLVASAMKVPNMSNNHSEMFPRRKCFHGPLSNICFLSNSISQSHLNSSKKTYFGFSDPTEEAQDYASSKTRRPARQNRTTESEYIPNKAADESRRCTRRHTGIKANRNFLLLGLRYIDSQLTDNSRRRFITRPILFPARCFPFYGESHMACN
jgi:hypothetical protein